MISPYTCSCEPATASMPDWSSSEPELSCDATQAAAPSGNTDFWVTHRVEPGEILSEIAARYQVTVSTLAEANQLETRGERNRLSIGQLLKIPIGEGSGVAPVEVPVAPGDTLQRLAVQHGKTVRQVVNANRHAINNADLVIAGRIVQIPGQRGNKLLETGPCTNSVNTSEWPGHRSLQATKPALQTARDQNASAAAQPWLDALAHLEAQLSSSHGDATEQRLWTRNAVQALDIATRGLDASAAARVVQDALPALESYAERVADTIDPQVVGPLALQTLMAVLDRIGGTPEGDAAVERIAHLELWEPGAVSTALARGTGLGYVVALSKQPDIDSDKVLQAAYDGLDALRRRTADDTLAYATHTAELGWLVGNFHGVMTPQQLNQAIDDYTLSKGAAWQAETERLKRAIVADGAALLEQAGHLGTLPESFRLENERARGSVTALLNDTLSQAAIRAALQQRPEIAVGQRWHDLLTFFSEAQYVSTAKVTDQARKMASEFATAYVNRQVLLHLEQLDMADTSAATKLMDRMRSFNDSRMATILGVPKHHLDRAVAALETLAAASGESEEVTRAQLARLDKELSSIKGFDKSTTAGQATRFAGIALAGVGFLASVDRAKSELSIKNTFKVMVDAAGLGQKGIELAVALHRVEKGSAVARLGGTGVGKFLGAMTALYDLWNAAEAVAKGDLIRGSLYGAGAGGGLMAAYGSGLTGPLGFLLVGGSVVGLGVLKDAKRAKLHEPEQDNGTSLRFLRHAGMSLTAAVTLVDQSEEGNSVVPLLARYAELRGLTMGDPAHQQRFSDWLNGITMGQLIALRGALQDTMDSLDGSAAQLPPNSRSDAGFSTDAGAESAWSNLSDPTPLSAAQIDLLLESLHIPSLGTSQDG